MWPIPASAVKTDYSNNLRRTSQKVPDWKFGNSGTSTSFAEYTAEVLVFTREGDGTQAQKLPNGL
jgi:hypothetical protein